MKKGFTLIEILAVVTIMGLIFILVIPKIGTSLKHKKKDVDTTTNNLIITAAKNYVNDNQDTFDKIDTCIRYQPRIETDFRYMICRPAFYQQYIFAFYFF